MAPDSPESRAKLDVVDWDDLRRREFPVAQRWAYLDHAAVAPLPRSAGDTLRKWVESQENDGVVLWPQWEARLGKVRRDLARLLNARPDEVAFVNSTTQGIGLVAEGFPWRDGDNVVTAEDEYPSNLYPWLNLAGRGVTVRLVPTRSGRIWIDDLAAAIDGRTRVLTISHVEFASGFRNDLDAIAELCHTRGVALFVDAIQGLGPFVYDIERTPIDFLCADGHKWLLGPEGAGVLFVRREWIERLRPLGVGWHSVTTSYNHPTFEMKLKPSAERWEGGSFAMPGLQAFGTSVELLLGLGSHAVSQRILDNAQAVRELALSAGWSLHGSTLPADLSGIVALEREGVDPRAVSRRARDLGIVVASRRGRLRVSPHVYNNRDDLDRLALLLHEAASV
jgi:selenocysteine lyase/cysteine desulfurase